jgi:hypothetical protein
MPTVSYGYYGQVPDILQLLGENNPNLVLVDVHLRLACLSPLNIQSAHDPRLVTLRAVCTIL